jgi:hypothetical protein
MDHVYAQEDMNFDLVSGFTQQYAPVDPYLENMFAPSTPKHSGESSAPYYNYQDDGPSGCDTFMPEAMPHDYHEGPITPESTTHHIEPNDNQSQGAVEEPNEHTADVEQEKETDYPPEYWRTLINFEIPDFTKTSINDIPGVQALHAAYLHNHGPLSTATNATRMQYAKALAFGLLTHYYPASQGYTVAPTSLGPVTKNGMSFTLAADNKSDIWKDMRKKKIKANRRRVPTKKERERAVKAEQAAKVAEYSHGFAYMANLQWDFISPRDIAAFVVMRETETTNKETGVVTYEQRPYTYLAILVDNFDTLPRFSTNNISHRSDVLTDALCRGGKIQNGHSLLLYGPRLEFYTFDRGKEWVYLGDDEEDDDKGKREAQDIEPKMEVQLSDLTSQALDMDLRTAGLNIVDAAFRHVAARDVVYMGEAEIREDEDAGSADDDGDSDVMEEE